MGTFLVVQTKENGERLLSTVPVQWVVERGKQKTLYWPNTKNVEKYRRNSHSVPDFQSWSQTPCIILNRNVKTFQEGRALEKDLSGFSDTEEEENEKAFRNLKRMHPVRGTALNFNHQVEILQNVASEVVDTRPLHLNSPRTPENIPRYSIPQTGQIINITDISQNAEVANVYEDKS